MPTINKAADEIERLQAELERAWADTKRLDWLADRDNHIGNVQLPTACVEANLSDMRAAIDAAMTMSRAKFMDDIDGDALSGGF